MSWRLTFALLVAGLVGMSAPACSSTKGEPTSVVEEEAGVITPIDAGKRDSGPPPPPTPATPTPRCGTPKPPVGTYVPPAPVSDAGDAGDGGVEDASDADVDATILDAGVDDAGEDAAIGPLLSVVRPPAIVSSGGPVLSMPRWIPIFFKDTDDAIDFEDFLGSIGCTSYWHAVADDYGVGEGISAPSVTIPEDAPQKVSDAQISKFLVDKMKAGVIPKPQPNDLYVVFYPYGTIVQDGELGRSCLSFGGYHYQAVIDGVQFPYAVIPRCSTFSYTTATTSHELIEAVTDPFPLREPAFQLPSGDDIAWAYPAGGEVADLCNFIDSSNIEIDGYPYTVQRSFSNKSSAEGHDPCVPPIGPYFYAAPTMEDVIDQGQKGIYVAPATSRQVDVTLGSDAPVGTLRVELVTGEQVSSRAPPAQSTFTLSATSGVVGDHLILTIEAAPDATGTEVFAITAGYKNHQRSWYGMVGH